MYEKKTIADPVNIPLTPNEKYLKQGKMWARLIIENKGK